jgi:hypothetical protein
MQVPKYIGKTNLSVITKFGKKINFSKEVNRVKTMIFNVLGITGEKQRNDAKGTNVKLFCYRLYLANVVSNALTQYFD